MCGIVGYINLKGDSAEKHILDQMNHTLVHRGPDGAGYFLRDNMGLAMRRLSIIDIDGSEQPLFNEDQSVVMVFNGEIYNYRQLRENLIAKGHQFRTDGDGETIVHSYEENFQAGELRGQFAFALWDDHEKKLILRRDYTGQKPLYYYQDERVFVFASEIKAILQHPAVMRESALTDPILLSRYLSYGYIPAPDTAFKQIKMLLPGYELILKNGKIKIHPFWQMPPLADKNSLSEHELIEQLRDHLRDAVAHRMIADVSLGAFLSGGLDSSLIVSLMQAISNQTVKTFSIGFDGDDSFDESDYAQQVARYLKTDHTVFRVQPEAMSLLDRLVWHHDAPFADSSAIPTFLVSELTRQRVTVALTGDGGDELFAGYDRFYAATLLQKMQMIPRPLWKTAAALLKILPEGTGYYNFIKRGGRFVRGAGLPPEQAYFSWVRIFSAELIEGLTGLSDDIAYSHFQAYFTGQQALVDDILRVNFHSYLPDDLLIKADRCSMAASLEARAPFLDHKLIEFAATIPLDLKLRGSTSKYILKEAARGLLPDHIIDRKKHGFGVPLGTWLRKDIQLVRDMLLSQSARKRGLLNMQAVETLISDHSSGKRDHGQRLWTLLTLESWHRQFIDSDSVRARAQ